eukprot:Selendium_serpulae@DN6176_c0_g3_i1.p1
MWDSRQPTDEAVRAHSPKFQGVLFVVDASDMGRLNIAARGFEQLLKDLPHARAVVIYATKVDKIEAGDPEAIKAKIMGNLGLKMEVEREWRIFLCSAKDG